MDLMQGPLGVIGGLLDVPPRRLEVSPKKTASVLNT
jgi:hypothetical protein